MQLQTPIEPVATSKPAVTAVCNYVHIQFGSGDEYANACIILLDQEGSQVSIEQVKFTENELADWGTDDTFIINLALTKLGYIPA